MEKKDNDKKRSFLMQMSYKDAVHALSDSQAGKVFKALFEYVDSGEMPTTGDQISDVVLLMMKSGVDEAADRYAKMCEQRKNAIKSRWEKEKRDKKNTDEYERINSNTTEFGQIRTSYDRILYDNEYDNDIKESTLSKERVPKKDEPSLPSQGKNKEGHIDWQAFQEYFNKTFEGKLPAIQKMTQTRMQAVRARVAQYGKDKIPEAYKKILESDFLLGNNDKNWRADFDWIFKASNFTKILEGNYSEKARGAGREKPNNITNVNDEWENRR